MRIIEAGICLNPWSVNKVLLPLRRSGWGQQGDVWSGGLGEKWGYGEEWDQKLGCGFGCVYTVTRPPISSKFDCQKTIFN